MQSSVGRGGTGSIGRIPCALIGAILVAAGLAWFAMAGVPAAEAAYPGTNGKIVFDGGDHGLWAMNPDGSGAAKLTDPPIGSDGRQWADLHPSFSPDGKSIAFMSNGPEVGSTVHAHIYVMGSDGSGRRRLTTAPQWEEQPAFLADGRIVFSRTVPSLNRFDLFVANADGSGEQQLTQGTTGTELIVAAAPSPDGRTIAYVRATGSSPSEVWVMNTDGSGQRMLALGSDPDFSPDGKRIAFIREGDVWVMNADGTGQTRVTATAEPDESEPVFSPEGDQIAYTRMESLDTEEDYFYWANVYVMKTDGTSQTALTHNYLDGWAGDPTWGVGTPRKGGESKAPETKITKAPKGKVTSKKAKFAFEADQQGAAFECKLDKGRFKSCTSPVKVKVKRGKHTFQVRAIGADGKPDASPAVAKWTVKKKK